MADTPIHVIRVSPGAVDPQDLAVKPADVVLWVPKTTAVKVKVRFNSKSPFAKAEMGGGKGASVKGIVKSNAAAGDYPYSNMAGQRKARRTADPVIIVRDTLGPKTSRSGKKKARRR